MTTKKELKSQFTLCANLIRKDDPAAQISVRHSVQERPNTGPPDSLFASLKWSKVFHCTTFDLHKAQKETALSFCFD